MKPAPSSSPIFPVLAGALILLLAVGGAWWAWQLLGQVQEEVQTLTDRQGRPGLAQILTRPDGVALAVRETGQLAKLREEIAREDGDLTDPWSRAYEEAQGAGQDWSKDPGRWKDRLIQMRSDLFRRSRESPADRRVLMQDDFFLGLEAFQQRSPAAADLPEVSRDLSAAFRLASLLLDAKDAVAEAYPTPCRLLSLAVPSGNQSPAQERQPPPARPAAGEGGSAGGLAPRFAYEIEIECSPELLFDYVDRLSRDTWLWVPREVRVTNELATFPSRSEIRKGFLPGRAAAGEGEGTTAPAEAPKLLQVLAGKEKIKTKIRLDLIGWPSGQGASSERAVPKS